MIFLARAHWIPYCSKTVFKADFKAALGRQLKWLKKCFTQFRERGWNAESTSPLCHLTVKHTHACQTKRPTLLFSAQLESKCRHMLIGNLGRHKWSSSTLEPSCYLLSWRGFMLADVSWLLYSWDFGHFFFGAELVRHPKLGIRKGNRDLFICTTDYQLRMAVRGNEMNRYK